MTARMVPATRRDIDVQVLVDDTWYDGNLEHWRRDGDRWTGFVRWSRGPGMNHIGW